MGFREASEVDHDLFGTAGNSSFNEVSNTSGLGHLFFLDAGVFEERVV